MALVRTVVVCAPKIFSVIPEPKAAPNPSLRGRCMRTTKVSSTQTITRTVSKIGIKIDSHIRAGNMGRCWAVVKGGEGGAANGGSNLVGRGSRTAKTRFSARPASGIDAVYSAVALAEPFRGVAIR